MCLLLAARSGRDSETSPCSHAIGVPFYVPHPESLMKVKYVDISLFRRMHDIDFSGAQSITPLTPTSHNLLGGHLSAAQPIGHREGERGGGWGAENYGLFKSLRTGWPHRSNARSGILLEEMHLLPPGTLSSLNCLKWLHPRVLCKDQRSVNSVFGAHTNNLPPSLLPLHQQAQPSLICQLKYTWLH